MTAIDAPQNLPATGPRMRGAVAVLVRSSNEQVTACVSEIERRGHAVTVIEAPPLSIDSIRATLVRLRRAPIRTSLFLLRHPRIGPCSIYLADLLPRLGVAHVHSFLEPAITAATNIHCTSSMKATVDDVLQALESHDGPRSAALDEIGTADWNRLGARLLSVQRLHERAASIVAEIAISDGVTRRNVVLKKQREGPNDPRPSAESARIEYSVLSALRDSMTETVEGVTYSVPRALILDEKHATVVMERAAGTPLDRIISRERRRRTPEELEVPLRQAGRWLRLMQQHTRSDEDGRYILTSLVHLALTDLDEIAKRDAGVRKKRGRIIDHIHSLETCVANGPLPVVGHHGDFWPGNVFIAPASVEVIDFEGFREGLPLEDVVYHLSYLELLPLASRQYPNMERAFLAGFEGDEPVDPAALRLFRLMHAIRTVEKMAHESKSSIRSRIVHRTLRNIIMRSVR
ncbi:MAG: aminoglycoside phosphotransferase family protein [Acidobacteriota bacterium]|nr:aminoglycoside phosphotransferase family protein [Acidobacteriota bacterium]